MTFRVGTTVVWLQHWKLGHSQIRIRTEGPELGHYQVALSFAGEQRDYAYSLARRLQSFGVAVFYDEFFGLSFFGEPI